MFSTFPRIPGGVRYRIMADKLQKQRFEYKYHVDEGQADGIRDFLRHYMTLDEYGATRPDHSYPVHTLYLDSPDLQLYQATINGDRNRFKLRIRYYENGDDSAVYAEIKRRYNAVITKSRAAITRESARHMARGQLPGPAELVKPEADSMRALEEFNRLTSLLNAGPVAHIAYLREAWIGEDAHTRTRVTLDRQVMSEPHHDMYFSFEMKNPKVVFGDTVVLELKFTNRFPHWFKELVQAYELKHQSAAKYVDGVALRGEHYYINEYI